MEEFLFVLDKVVDVAKGTSWMALALFAEVLLIASLISLRRRRRKRIGREVREAEQPIDHRLMPEALVQVECTDKEIVCSNPDGSRQRVAWSEIVEVWIQTTSDGPWTADVFWCISSQSRAPAVVVPGGATGEEELLRALQERLKGVDNEAIVRAMASATDQRFVIWRAPQVTQA